MVPSLLPIFVTFAFTIGSILLLKPLAFKVGLVDKPGGRKFHQGNIPLIGGIGIFLGFAFALLTLDISLSQFRGFIGGAVILVITGMLDDFSELTPRARLFVQIFVGFLITIWGDTSLQSIGNIFALGNIALGYFALPFTILAVVLIINAVNMTDGVDGLAGTVALIEFFYLFYLAQHSHHVMEGQILFIIMTALLAFLFFNFPWRQHASIFMGDAGSMMLGFFLVWFCIHLSQPANSVAKPVTFLWIMAVPIFDIASVVLRRLARGISPFHSDRGHFHHYLERRGFSPLMINFSLGLLTGLVGLVGIISEHFNIHETVMFFSFIMLFILYLYLLRRGWEKLESSGKGY